MDDDSKLSSEDSAGSGPSSELLPRAEPTRYCSKCATLVVPNAKGQCPVCGTFTTGNEAARKHLANVARRKQYLFENIAEYKPDTLLLRDACRLLANTRERLDTIREGTPEHQRLIATWTELTATLEASRTSRELHTSDAYAGLTDDQLIERTATVLRGLLKSHDEQRKGQAYLAALSREVSAPEGEAGVPPLAPAPEPEPICPHCHRVCVGPTHFAYDVLHWDDPDEVKKRTERATSEMLASMGRARRGEIPRW